MTLRNIYLKWFFCFTVLLLPLLNFKVGDFRFDYQSYKFGFVVLIILLVTKIKFNRTLLNIFVLLCSFSILSYCYNYYQIQQNILLEKSVLIHSSAHMAEQLLLHLFFIALIVAIVSTKIRSSLLRVAFKTHIVSLVSISLISIFLLFLEMIGLNLIGNSYSLGTYKLRGLLGEPKQFSAAMLSGFVLLMITKKVGISFFDTFTTKSFLLLFLFSALASFSSSLIVSLCLFLLLFYFVNGRFQRILFLMMLLIVCLIGVAELSKNCESMDKMYQKTTIGNDKYTILRKISSFGAVVSFIPKDGAVIVDAICRPKNYILGQGPGGFYREFMEQKLSNFDSLLKIKLFMSMYLKPLSVTQAPSTYQVRLFSDYGLIGVLLFLLLLATSEKILYDGSNKYYSIVMFFVFFMSIQYFMFSIMMYFLALKSRPLPGEVN